mgnify:FL=1
METAEIFKKLAEPIEVRWRVGKNMGDKFSVLAYLDARQVQQRLDDIVGPNNWGNVYDSESGTATLSIRVDGEWIHKTDVGTESQVEKEKGKSSDALKRAAVLWGIGRFLYTDKKYSGKMLPKDPSGKYCMTSDKKKVLYNGEQISLYMNGLSTSMGLLNQIWHEEKELQSDPKFLEAMTNLKKYL